jgi:hypothetical protein
LPVQELWIDVQMSVQLVLELNLGPFGSHQIS